ncbi:hypothetical protein SAMN04515674_101168 [Pseudarcicella hirudinis]|uniref:Tetratricopeptide repeat-containing protein n=1 Tax=Pseudarcicella hirudinis TaxID=1079859 RepID=A0A1I5M7B8_9BACT|nr:hypothetical protein [Pseudarcicella hirudinis]SFP05474.1 hypothetical protein SAMN04515674_101168 [Pseudarcicella hirudinis]
MNFDDENYRLDAIERFCRGEMNTPEKEEFDRLLTNDPLLAKEVDDYKRLLTIMKAATIESRVRATLAELEITEPIGLTPVVPRWKKPVFLYLGSLAAACVLFILYASISSVQLPGSENDLTIVRDVDPAVLSSSQKSAFDHFYAGQSHIAEGQFQTAVLDFQEVLKTENLRPYFEEATKWHLVLAYLGSNQPQNARKIYNELDNCTACVYPVGFMNKSKLWWKIFWANLF